MKELREIAIIVQARLSSKRIPNKMLEPFASSTLIDICLEKIKQSKVINMRDFYFSVYEDELKDVAAFHNVNIWSRSEVSANSEGTPITELFDWWNKLGSQYKYAIVISACVPLLKIETIDEFVQAYTNSVSDGMLGVVEKRNYFWDHDSRLVTPWPIGHEIMNTKFVKPTYEAAQCLYAGKLSRLEDGIWMGKLYGDKNEVELFPVAEEESYDIDYPNQFKVIEALYRVIS